MYVNKKREVNKMTNFENCYEAKEAFWNIWKKNKVCSLSRLDIDIFDGIVSFFSKNVEEMDCFGKFQGFAAKILTRNEVKMCAKGYAFLATIKDEEFAHRVCTSEKLWNMAA